MIAAPKHPPSHSATPSAANDNCAPQEVPLGCHLHQVSDTAYDPVGNLEKIRYFRGATTKYSYDQSGRMQDARFSFNGLIANENPVASYNYDSAGRLLDAYHGDKDKIAPVSVNPNYPAYARSRYAYDADSDLNRLTTQWSRPDLDRTTLLGFAYKYAHDEAAKLVNAYATGASWRFKPTANKTEDYLVGGEANALDQYGSIDLGDGAGPQVQSYDGAGNLISDGAGRTYTYNSENQMIRAQGSGLDIEYWYDAEGRRSHSIDHVAGTEVFHHHLGEMEIGDYLVTRAGGAGTPSYILPNAAPTKLLEITASFQIILGTGTDNRIAYYDTANNEMSFYLTNHQGSVIAMTREDGALKDQSDGGIYVYDPYGNDAFKGTAKEAPLSGNPYRYTGRRLDAQTGLYYYRARYYSTKWGRFLQTDPIGTADGMNVYAYVGNNPLNATDPSGLAATQERETKGNDALTTGGAALKKQVNKDLSTRLKGLGWSGRLGTADMVTNEQWKCYG